MPTLFNVAKATSTRRSGPVVREQDGWRVLQAMTGLSTPRRARRPASRSSLPVNNIADLSSFMWRFVAPVPNRCLIPLTAFCEAEGEKGAKTRTRSASGQPIVARAGMWKDSHEWGAVYSGLMTDCNEAVRLVHNRMPVLLHEEDHEPRLRGSLRRDGLPGRCYPDALIAMERTDLDQAQRRGAATTSSDTQVSVLFLPFSARSAIMRALCNHGRSHSCNHG